MSNEFNINQAVVLCGGLGLRLRPLTENLPKPMIDINGKPFLFYLLEQLSEQGINNFLLLTGYLGEKIQEYFKDGSQYGWNIQYSKGPVEWDTGRRIWEARGLIESEFMLLYSDNFIQFNLNSLAEVHCKTKAVLSFILVKKNNGNIALSKDGVIQNYDKDRQGFELDYVELGYMIIHKQEIFEYFTHISNFPDFNFSSVIKLLVLDNKISGLVVHDSYYSISDPTRLHLMTEYLKPKKILLLDRDGTINKKAYQGEYITKWADFEWIDDTRNGLERLSQQGFSFVILTNQAGIARGIVDPNALDEIHKKMVEELAKNGVNILKIYICPDHWNSHSFMRKPAPGMFFKASYDFKLRLDRTFYIGDDERDCIAAFNAGCGMIFINNEEEKITLNNFPVPFVATKSLNNSTSYIINTYNTWNLS